MQISFRLSLRFVPHTCNLTQDSGYAVCRGLVFNHKLAVLTDVRELSVTRKSLFLLLCLIAFQHPFHLNWYLCVVSQYFPSSNITIICVRRHWHQAIETQFNSRSPKFFCFFSPSFLQLSVRIFVWVVWLFWSYVSGICFFHSRCRVPKCIPQHACQEAIEKKLAISQASQQTLFCLVETSICHTIRSFKGPDC